MKRTQAWNWPLLLGLVMIGGLAVFLVLPFFLDLDPMTPHMINWLDGNVKLPPLAPGQLGHPLGTDAIGRDLLARLIYGARLTMFVGASITALRALLAIPLGLAAGWFGGRLSYVTSLISSSASALPTLILVVFVMHGLRAFRTDQTAVWFYIGVVALAGLPRLAEQVRRLTETVKDQPYIESAIAAGTPVSRILFRHVLPVIRGDLAVAMAAETAWVLMLMGQLAVFGVYMDPPVHMEFPDGSIYPKDVDQRPEWGTMLGVNRWAFRNHPWIALYPALALGATAASLQLIAEGLRQRWLHR